MKFHVESACGFPDAVFDDEVPPRSWLLSMFLGDMRGQEDLYLAEIAKAEAGETITDLYNNLVHVYLYPDHYPDQVVLEDMWDPALADESAEGPRRCTTLTLAEAKQLILDWLEAKKRWEPSCP